MTLINKETGLLDYKFYCFQGSPEFLYISQGMENHKTAKISFVTKDWQKADFGRSDYRGFEKLPKRPEKFEKMLKLAEKLSKGVPFLRVDLYEINGRIYFSELTFSPCSGFMPFEPIEADYEVGKILKIGETF